tara:strand:+ start:339 stop:500 length:162 start_codon:yes stop_codon:yes gene_type:complete
VTAFIEGMGPDNRAYKQAATLMMDKGTDVAALEIRIQDESSRYQPSVNIVEWE